AAAPATLLTGQRYTPGTAYVITARLVGEHRGLGSPRSNYNALVFTALDPAGVSVGTFSGYSAEDLYESGGVVASSGKKPNVTSWTFTWTAPPAGTGQVTLHAALVDGNGANSPPSVTLTDPWDDD